MNMLPRIVILALFLTFSLHGFPQKFIAFKTYDVDSLRAVLPGQSGEERVATLNWLAASLSFVDEKMSRQYADSAMALAKELDSKAGMADAFRNYGHIYKYFGKYPQALTNFFEALSICQEMDDKYREFWLYYFIATTHYFANNKEKTIEYGNIALEKCQESLPGGATVGSLKDMVIIKLGLAQTYTDMGLLEESIKIRREMLGVMKENHFTDTEILITAWTLGADYYGLGKLDSARVLFQEAISMATDEISSKAQKYRALMWLADLQNAEGKTDSAIANMKNALKWYDENGILLWAVYASNFLGNYYYYMNELQLAQDNFKTSENLFKEMLARNSFYRSDVPQNAAFYGFELYFPVPPLILKELMWNWGEWLYQGLYLINEKENRNTEALKYHILYTNAIDTLHDIRQNRETVELQTRFEFEQKELQIALLSEENAFKSYKLRQSRIFLFGLAGLITLVILLAIALIRQGRMRERQNSLILQQKLFRSQMNPHFIFNSLASIHHFMIHEQPAIAASYLSRFSKLIRSILHSSAEEYTSVSSEVSMLENYLELQKVRFPGKFDFRIETDEELDLESTFIPSMITQPFVENAIEHGIKNKINSGNILVSFMKKDRMIRIEVKDDGIGRERAGEIYLKQNQSHTSLSTNIIRERIKALNRTSKRKITLDILDLRDEQGEAAGTQVVLEVPLLSD
jgi:tetratricopeptide (TPR) repeat protein